MHGILVELVGLDVDLQRAKHQLSAIKMRNLIPAKFVKYGY